MKMRLLLLSTIVLASALAAVPALASAPLITGLGGPAGFGALTQQPNDDQSSSELDLPFAVNFFGATYDSFFVNNNGNVTFGAALGTFTPSPFPASNRPIIAPYWGDVDTRAGGGGAVYIGSPNLDNVVVTWNNVGYFSQQTNKLNNFQLVLTDRSDVSAGDFDITFRYNRLEWTTGGASGGVNGLGGVPAQAGYDAGNGVNAFTLPGSRTAAVLDLQDTSNVNSTTPGVWLLNIRNGAIATGATASAPLLPTIVDANGFNFNFNIQLGQRIFIDPEVAVGYDYVVSSGPNILRALFPLIPGDVDGFEIYGYSEGTGLYDNLLGIAMPGVDFEFGALGVSRFGLRDIEASPFLDPTNPLAFVTGLDFVGAGDVEMTQRPVTLFVPGGVPEPTSWAMLIAGFGLTGATMRRRRPAAA